MKIRAKALCESARGEDCSICGRSWANGESTVLAHANWLDMGKGVGTKAHDLFACFACFDCHNLLDGRTGKLMKAQKRSMFYDGWARTMVRWIDRGLVELV